MSRLSIGMGRLVRHALMGMALLLAGCLLIWEAGQPVIAAQFMVVLGRFDPQVCALMTPYALGAALTIAGMAMGIVSLRRGRATLTWLWLILADVVAPIVALIGHSAAIGFVGVLPT